VYGLRRVGKAAPWQILVQMLQHQLRLHMSGLPPQVTFELEPPESSSATQPSANGGSASSPSTGVEATDGAANMDHKQLWDALQRGIRWPSPAESPPFWDRPARDAPLLLGAAASLVHSLRSLVCIHAAQDTRKQRLSARHRGEFLSTRHAR